MRKHSFSRSGWLGLAVALAAAVLSVSCGGGNVVADGNGGNPASLTLNTSLIDFGGVAVGSSKQNQVTLTNASAPGGASITVTQITTTGTGFSTATPQLPLTLSPGQSANATITFAPKSAGPFDGQLSIQIQGVTQPATVTLAGTGLAPGQLSVSPANMDFGDVAVGTNQEQTGTLSAGASDITVSSASWNGDGFSLSGITFPVVVPASQSVPFTVTFAPTVAGSSSGSISFISDASNSPTNETLQGNGFQPSQHSVDLTWIASPSQVVGYNIYRGSSPGTHNNKLNGSPVPGTSFTDHNVQSGKTYYYVARSVDSNSQESVDSNEAQAVIPNP
jgi:hypothetical protein